MVSKSLKPYAYLKVEHLLFENIVVFCENVCQRVHGSTRRSARNCVLKIHGSISSPAQAIGKTHKTTKPSEMLGSDGCRMASESVPSDPDGSRTRVTAVKGRCPRPLDDGANVVGILRPEPTRKKVYVRAWFCQVVCSTEERQPSDNSRKRADALADRRNLRTQFQSTIGNES
jgi:hypothetical protein